VAIRDHRGTSGPPRDRETRTTPPCLSFSPLCKFCEIFLLLFPFDVSSFEVDKSYQFVDLEILSIPPKEKVFPFHVNLFFFSIIFINTSIYLFLFEIFIFAEQYEVEFL